MSIFDFEDDLSIGRVHSVDTATIVIKVDQIEKLRKLQVNHLIAIKSSKSGQHLIGIINRITRKSTDEATSPENIDEYTYFLTENILKVNLIGTLLDKVGSKNNVFKRTLDTVPEIDANCFPIIGDNITKFMKVISSHENYDNPLSLGKYSIDENAEAFLDGNKLFQRHAVIVGSTGSGKSWCVAKLIEQTAKLPMANAILFDIHGEYSGEHFKADGIQHIKVANPEDLGKKDSLLNNILMLPYWLLTYEEMLAMLLDRSDSNAPNQAMIFSKTVFEAKETYLDSIGDTSFKGHITIDSPIPYCLKSVLNIIRELDVEMVPGSGNKEKQGPFNGKLTRFIQRLDAKSQDKRLGFLFQITIEELDIDWLNKLCNLLMCGTKLNDKDCGIVSSK